MKYPFIIRQLFQFKRNIIFFSLVAIGLLNAVNIEIKGQTPTNAENKIENYRIGAGDILDVLVSKNQTLTRTGVRVSNEGMIQLAMIENEIPAACRTEKELSNDIAEKYKKYLLNPNVIVAVKEFNSTPVALIGSVVTPTRFQMQRPTRLLEVLMLGSGPNEKAGPTIQIIRNPKLNGCSLNVTSSVDSVEQLITFSLNDTLRGEDSSNPFIQAGDVIRIPEAEVEKIGQAYIVGNVKSAKTIDLKEPVTLTQAVAMAGGTSPDAQLERVKISRQIAGTLNKREIIINLKEVNKKNSGDILLEANDIIDVPGPTGTKKFLKDIFKSVLPAVTRFPIIP